MKNEKACLLECLAEQSNLIQYQMHPAARYFHPPLILLSSRSAIPFFHLSFHCSHNLCSASTCCSILYNHYQQLREKKFNISNNGVIYLFINMFKFACA